MSSRMKINYYDQFKCTADQCPFSCCQQWKIGVDEATYTKWQGKTVNDEKQQAISLCGCVKEIDEGKVIGLNSKKNCPFLNEKKLCNIVIEHGEAYLSETCTTFPRQINHFKDRTEYSLDACCPVVIDMMKEQTGKNTFTTDHKEEVKDNLFLIREMMLSVIEEERFSLPKRLMMIFYSLLELLERKSLSAKEIKKCEEKAYLQEIADAISNMNFYTMDTLYEGNELFLDVVENYRRQGLYTAYIEPIAKVAEALEEDHTEEELVASFEQFGSLYKQYEHLIKNYLVSEIFGSGLLEDMEREDMLVAFEWVSMEYAVVRQAIYLKWLLEGQKESLDYEIVKQYLMIISRVTGYDLVDIREYLENSFEEVIWEWGYLALIVGNDCM